MFTRLLYVMCYYYYSNAHRILVKKPQKWDHLEDLDKYGSERGWEYVGCIHQACGRWRGTPINYGEFLD